MQDKIKSLELYIQKLPHSTISHSCAVGTYTQMLADRLCRLAGAEELPYCQLPMREKAHLIGRYHDIGKAGISNVFWESPCRFSEVEYKLAQMHTVIGAYFVKPELSLPVSADEPELESRIVECCLFHHEHWDGTGYPFRLSGEQIPLYARIVALADCYDAMTEQRPYKEKLSPEAALAEIQRQKGRQFDPVLADIFCEAMQEPDNTCGE